MTGNETTLQLEFSRTRTDVCPCMQISQLSSSSETYQSSCAANVSYVAIYIRERIKENDLIVAVEFSDSARSECTRATSFERKKRFKSLETSQERFSAVCLCRSAPPPADRWNNGLWFRRGATTELPFTVIMPGVEHFFHLGGRFHASSDDISQNNPAIISISARKAICESRRSS